MGESDLMLDRSLTAADFTPAQADALADALRLVVEQGGHVTSDQQSSSSLAVARRPQPRPARPWAHHGDRGRLPLNQAGEAPR